MPEGLRLFILIVASASAMPSLSARKVVGDSRINNPDNIVLDVTITVAGNMASWVIDINSPAHPSAKLDEFYFNLASISAGSLTFSGFNPMGWTINAPASVQGAGGTTFQFEAAKTAPSAANVTNTQNLVFTMTSSAGAFTTANFMSAPVSVSNDAGKGQLGAHVQSLSTQSRGQSDSGFAFGSYGVRVPPSQVPEPGTLPLIGLGAIAGFWMRRRTSKAH